MFKKTLALIFSLMMATTVMAYDSVIQQRHDSILSVITGAPSQSASHIQQTRKSITSFGAKGNGTTDCLPAFRKAMKQASKMKDGLHIIVPQGEWFVKGPIHLVSNVTIELQEGATLKFSPDPKDYLPAVSTSWEGSFCQNYSPFIYGYGLKNVAIIGRCTIDGNCAETFPRWKQNQKVDQMLSRLITMMRRLLSNVTLERTISLYIKTNPNRGGFVRGIYFQNVEFGEVEDLFYITSMYAGEGADDNHFTDIEDIHVKDVHCQKANNAAIILQGTQAKPLRNITFENVSVGECKIGFASTNTLGVTITNCAIGGVADAAPSQASEKDKVFER